MQRNHRGSVAAGLLLAAAVFGFAGYVAGTRADAPGPAQQGIITNGRFIQDPMPGWPDPGAQRQEMIDLLKSLNLRAAELDARLSSMKTVLEAIERHERNSYVMLGNQIDASPNEKNR